MKDDRTDLLMKQCMDVQWVGQVVWIISGFYIKRKRKKKKAISGFPSGTCVEFWISRNVNSQTMARDQVTKYSWLIAARLLGSNLAPFITEMQVAATWKITSYLQICESRTNETGSGCSLGLVQSEMFNGWSLMVILFIYVCIAAKLESGECDSVNFWRARQTDNYFN